MALKAGRSYTNEATDISYFMNATGERGGIVIHSTGGSGEAMDDADAVVAYPTGQGPSGTEPAGLLLCDVVKDDLTRQHLNFYKDEVRAIGRLLKLPKKLINRHPFPGPACRMVEIDYLGEMIMLSHICQILF
jgi:hypothetical protein